MAKGTNSKGWMTGMASKITWTVLLAGLAGLIYLAGERKRNLVFDAVEIEIRKTEMGRNLITEEDLKLAVRNHLGFELDISSIADINAKELEELLNRSAFIENAEVYVTGDQKIKIEVTQREPIVRVQPEAGNPYYLDKSGDKVPVIKNFAVRVPLATGQINKYTEEYRMEENNLNKLFQLATAVKEDEFLGALIEQIHFETEDKIILIPKVGKEKIIFGDITQIDEKLSDLKLFYKEGMTREGWNKFAYLNLEFEDQVIGVLK